MTPKQYLAVQIMVVETARQVAAIDRLEEFLKVADEARSHENEGPLGDPDFEQARKGLAHVRDLAAALVVVKQKSVELDAYFRLQRPRAPLKG